MRYEVIDGRDGYALVWDTKNDREFASCELRSDAELIASLLNK